jgi:hypothetical protein
MRVTNGVPLGCSVLIPVHTVNSARTLKVWGLVGRIVHTNHELCHHTDDVTQHCRCGEWLGVSFVTLTLTLTLTLTQTLQVWGMVGRIVRDWRTAGKRGYSARFPTEIYTRGCHWLAALPCV